jgi:hypothetical protein
MATTFTSNYATGVAATWVTLVEAPASFKYIVRHYMCANFSGVDTTLGMRVVNGADVEQAVLLDSYIVDAAVPLNVTPAFIVLDPGYKLQVKFATSSASAAAWGGYDE